MIMGVVMFKVLHLGRPDAKNVKLETSQLLFKKLFMLCMRRS